MDGLCDWDTSLYDKLLCFVATSLAKDETEDADKEAELFASDDEDTSQSDTSDAADQTSGDDELLLDEEGEVDEAERGEVPEGWVVAEEGK